MRALLIHQAYVSSGEAGGTRHAEFGQHFRSNGDELVVVASQVSYLSGKPVRKWAKRRIVQRDDVDGLTVYRAFSPSTLHRGFGWRVLAFIIFALTSVWAGLRSGPIDVVIGTSPPIFQAVSALVVARLKRVPYLLEIRDLWPEFAIDMGVLRNPVLKRLSRWLESFLYRNANHIVVNSPAYVTYLETKGVPSSKITFVSNGVDADQFDPSRNGSSFRRKHDIKYDTFLAVYAGAHGPANDLVQVLDAADHLRDMPIVQFLLVGNGKDKPKLQELARKRMLDNVSFIDSVSKREMPDVLAAANICIATLQDVPMFRMTYPNKVFDYMAAGKPTILTIDGVIRTVIEDAHGGMFAPASDGRALANAVRSLANRPDTVMQMGRNARSYVVANFNRSDQGEAFRATAQQLKHRKHKKAMS
jgi:glycosyltransferase involved in cell wall biosynthesis